MTSLRVLLAIAEHGTASGAAAAVNLTQSAVSKHLRALEETMGATFFTRGSRGLVPTEAGRIYIKHARTALAELETAGVRISALKASPWSVRLHVLPIIGDRWLLPRFSRFAEQYPDIDVQFTSFVTADTTEAADGTFRFGEGLWPGQKADYLFGRDVALVGAAPLLARFPSQEGRLSAHGEDGRDPPPRDRRHRVISFATGRFCYAPKATSAIPGGRRRRMR